ncbi:hypothetical protein BC940DRAFT_331770 [Gongronella butleri]|nr:hypothetical protein BC940DRAFT_331770 [Gongronella butleri]
MDMSQDQAPCSNMDIDMPGPDSCDGDALQELHASIRSYNDAFVHQMRLQEKMLREQQFEYEREYMYNEMIRRKHEQQQASLALYQHYLASSGMVTPPEMDDALIDQHSRLNHQNADWIHHPHPHHPQQTTLLPPPLPPASSSAAREGAMKAHDTPHRLSTIYTHADFADSSTSTLGMATWTPSTDTDDDVDVFSELANRLQASSL